MKKIVLLLILLSVFTGCFQSNASNSDKSKNIVSTGDIFIPDSTKRADYTFPERFDIANNKMWTITFYTAMTASDLNSNNIFITDKNGAIFPTTITIKAPNIVELKPNSNYNPERYCIKILSNIKTSTGIALNANYILYYNVAKTVVTETNAVYVSTTGNDTTGTGKIDSPYKTLQKALDSDQTVSGSSIILRNGTYKTFREIRVRKAGITIKSMDGEWAVIETPTNPVNDSGAQVDINDCENTYVMSFRMEWFNDDLTGVNSSGCKLQRLEIKGGAYYCIKFETTWDWDYSVPPSKRYGASNITIEDCKIHDSGYDCVKITEKCDNLIIRRTEIYNSGMAYPVGTPQEDKNAEGIDNVQGNGLLVEDCYIHDIATNGLYCKGGAKDCIIQRTKVERCGDGGILLGFDTSPEYFNTTTNPNYYENINGTIRNCVVADTNYEGIGLYASKDGKVYNNTLVNVSKNGAHSAIYFGVATQDYDPAAKRPPNINPSIYNNVVKQSKGVSNLMIAIRYSNELNGLSGLDGKATIDNNCYYIEGNTATFNDGRPASNVDGMNLTQWKSHISGETKAIEKDPMFGTDYHLLSGSPCINAGMNISSFNDDKDKKVRSNTYDIGAFEF